MKDYFRQAIVALQIYRDRGLRVIRYYKEGKMDNFDEALRKQAAAYHNFLAADSILKKAGVDLTDDPSAQKLWKEIGPIGDEIQMILLELRDELKSSLRETNKVRTNIGKYRTGIQFRSAIEHVV